MLYHVVRLYATLDALEIRPLRQILLFHRKNRLAVYKLQTELQVFCILSGKSSKKWLYINKSRQQKQDRRKKWKNCFWRVSNTLNPDKSVSSAEEKILGTAIDSRLNLISYIINICTVANQKLRAKCPLQKFEFYGLR